MWNPWTIGSLGSSSARHRQLATTSPSNCSGEIDLWPGWRRIPGHTDILNSAMVIPQYFSLFQNLMLILKSKGLNRVVIEKKQCV